MEPQPIFLCSLLFLSICWSGNLQKLPGSQDFIAIAKLLNLPYSPYFIPQLPLPPALERRKLFGLPPLPDHHSDDGATSTAMTIAPKVSSRTTLAPLLRLFTIPPILTLPPAPAVDSYGINTIPELPPQHESIYAGMFAPDGSLIERNTTVAKQTETNLIYEEEEKKGTGRGRGVRAATIRALDDRILGDDHNLFEDEKILDNHEKRKTLGSLLGQNGQQDEIAEQKMEANNETPGTFVAHSEDEKRSNDRDEHKILESFLLQNKPQDEETEEVQINAGNESFLMLPTQNEAASSQPTFGLVSLDTDAAIDNSSETSKLKVKSTTLTRLPIFVSSESDPTMKKHGKIVAVEGVGVEEPQRVFPKHSRYSSLRVLPVRSLESVPGNRTIVQFEGNRDRGIRDHELVRTTIKPVGGAPSAVINLRLHTEAIEPGDSQLLVPRANPVPHARNRLSPLAVARAQQLNGSTRNSRLPTNHLPQTTIFGEKEPRAEVNSAPRLNESVHQVDKSVLPRILNRATQQRDRRGARKGQILTRLPPPMEDGLEEVAHANSLPTAKVLPRKVHFPMTLQHPAAMEQAPHTGTAAAVQQQQRKPDTWIRTMAPRIWVGPAPAAVRYVPVSQYYYQDRQQQQDPLVFRDPQDAAYLREVEDYDHFWEAEHARTAPYAHSAVTAVPVVLNQQIQYHQPVQARAAILQTDQFIQQQQQQQRNLQDQAYLREVENYDQSKGMLAGSQLQPQGVVYLSTPSPSLYAIVTQSPLLFAPPQQQQQLQYAQHQSVQTAKVQPQTLPAPALNIRPDTLLQNFFGSLFGNQAQVTAAPYFPTVALARGAETFIVDRPIASVKAESR